MKRFSERMGYRKASDEFQIESMNDFLRNRLWNSLYKIIDMRLHVKELIRGQAPGEETEKLIVELWDQFLKRPINERPTGFANVSNALQQAIIGSEWYEVYDFFEFILGHWPYKSPDRQQFTNTLNVVLEKELSGYRIVDGYVTPITSKAEIEEVDTALTTSHDTVREHFKRALELLSDRESPDYRNSIKESISAVEALCKKIAGNEKATLGNALRLIRKKGLVELHDDLGFAFERLYSFTSDAEGIRHGLDELPNLSQEDARWMLISCSAFINYLTVKSSKAGIEL